MTKEQLLDALQRLMVETGSLDCLGCGHEHNCSLQGCNILREAVAALREQGERRWIPVTERLPDDAETVLTYKNGIIEVQVYKKMRNGWINGNWFWSMATVTHWMPLPEPPKEEDP